MATMRSSYPTFLPGRPHYESSGHQTTKKAALKLRVSYAGQACVTSDEGTFRLEFAKGKDTGREWTHRVDYMP